MAELMLVLGVLFLIGGIALEHPKLKRKFFDPWEYQDRKQYEDRILQLKGEVEKIKEDVVILLAEIDRASEGIAHRFETLVDKATVEEITPEKEPTKEKNRTQGEKKVVRVTEEQGNSNHKEILALASQGLTAEEIARKLKRGKGEVALILQLQGKGD